MRRAAEARRQGKRLRLHDEKGQLVNPYIPLYISKAPCMSPSPLYFPRISNQLT